MVLSLALTVMAACPFEVLRDESVTPPGTALATNGAVFLSAPVALKVECDSAHLRLVEPDAIAPISFRVSPAPLRLTLEVPKPEVREADAAVRTSTWRRWTQWLQRVKGLRRNPAVVVIAEPRDAGESAFDALALLVWEQQRAAEAAGAQQKEADHAAHKPFTFGAPMRVGTVVSASAEFLFWSRNQLCVVQGELPDGKFVRCYDPKTAKWTARAGREKWPRDATAMVLSAGKPRAGLLYNGECLLTRDQDAWRLEELGLDLDALPDDDVQKTTAERRELEADCAGCPGMMCTREQECRDRGWGSGELDAFNFACPQFLSVSSDGAYVAFVVDVTHDTVSCWANGYRCGEGTHEVVRSVVFVVPLQR